MKRKGFTLIELLTVIVILAVIAFRLLTAQEINTACNITVGSEILGELDNRNY